MKQKKIKRVVVKIGSRVLFGDSQDIDVRFMKDFVAGLARLHKKGYEIVIVSSGAIRTGLPILKLNSKRVGISQKQAAAAVGQGVLIAKYTEMFMKHGIVAAQVLLTADIMQERKTYLNARNTLRTLIDMKVVPIINENDTVAFEEIKFGDNDRLSAISSMLVDADLLILLSDVKGLCKEDPRKTNDAELLKVVEEITPEIKECATGPLEDGGVGGMSSKLDAAEIAAECGISMVITDGREKDAVERIVAGEQLGTMFLSKANGLSGRKRWLAYGATVEGRIIVNEGAETMIRTKGKSLLPSGIVRVDKDFDHGACVEICGPRGKCFGKGLSIYSSAEIRRIQGRQSAEIKDVLGYKISDVVVHRDDLALI